MRSAHAWTRYRIGVVPMLLGALIALVATLIAPAEARPETRTAAGTAPTPIYDTVTGSAPVTAMGQSTRLATPTTDITLAAKVSSSSALTVDDAVIAVRRLGDDASFDGPTTGPTTIQASRTLSFTQSFPLGRYEFFFSYLEDGEWHQNVRRAFTVTADGSGEVPQDPVSSVEQAGPLTSIGADIRSAEAVSTVRLAAQLSSPTPIAVDEVIFAVRGPGGGNYDLRPASAITSIGAATSVSATSYFSAGTYQYTVAYRQGSQWHDLGQPRTFVLTQPAAVPVPPQAGWAKVPGSSDEFTGTTLSSKWKKDIGYPRSGVLGFSPQNATVSSGALQLTARKQNVVVDGQTLSYTAGAVQSTFDVPAQPSYVEVRAKALSSAANVLSAIWLQSTPLSTASNPNPEIDLQETFDYAKISSTLHTWTIPADPSDPVGHEELVQRRADVGGDVSAAYHTYGLERRDGWLRFYFDGSLTWQVRPAEAGFTTLPRHVILSLEGHLGTPVAAKLPAAFQVDYVRTYTPTGQ